MLPPEWFWYLWLFIFGTIPGSFLNVVVLRFMAEESLGGRSRCPSCGATLSWRELIPILSFLFQRGRCRHCSAPISLQYPLVEIAAGCLAVLVGMAVAPFFLAAWWHGAVMALWLGGAWFFLLAIVVYDFKTQLIPDLFVYLLAVCALAYLFINPVPGAFFLAAPSPLTLLSGPLFMLPFLALWFFSGGRAMGFGDVKLALPLGWLAGPGGLISLFMLAFWVGAVVSLFNIALERAVAHMRPWLPRPFNRTIGAHLPSLAMGSRVPFGPFLVFALLLVFFFDANVLQFIQKATDALARLF